MTEDKASFKMVKKRRTAFVVFQGGDPELIPVPFTSPGWRHCWLMLPVYYPEPGLMAEVFTMKVEGLRWGVDTEVWWRDPSIPPIASLSKFPSHNLFCLGFLSP